MSTNSTNSSSGGGNGCRWLRFEYDRCWCRERASLKIVADSRRDSYGMLYFVCEKKGKVGDCGYFRWCYPNVADCVRNPTHHEFENQGGIARSREDIDGLKDVFVMIVACGALFFAILAFIVSLFK